MSCNKPLEKAIELIDAGNNIFITGGGGVGKSYILNKLKEHYGDTLDITSTTGVSAINVGGQTIHSWAGIGLANKSVNYTVNYKIRKNKSLETHIKECKLLAIDEVSMMSDKLIKYLDEVLQQVRQCSSAFGGLQVILIGDFFQLPPTKNKDNQDVDYCFNSITWQKLNLSTIYLTEVKRQNDKPYIDALNNIRTGVFNKKDIQIFENRNFPSDTRIDKNILQLFPLKDDTSKYNNECLEELSTKPIQFCATDTFYRYDLTDNKCNEAIDIVYPEKISEKISDITDLSKEFDNTEKYLILNFNKQCNAPQKLILKEGCRVMLLKNLNIEKQLVNGSCGQVTKLTKYDIEVLFDNGTKTKIEPVKFEYIVEGKIKIKRLQYPLMLAYAINNHKSQGMTFDKLVVNFQKIFGDGMGYVVLSRTRNLEGLYLKGFDCGKIQTSQKVIQFYKDLVNSQNCYIFGDKGLIVKENNTISNKIENPDTTEIKNNSNTTEKEIHEFDRIAALEAQVLELKQMVEKLTKSKFEEINIDDIYTDSSDEKTNYFIQAFEKFNQKEYDVALKLFKKCIENEPDNDKACFYTGCIWEIKGNYKKAIENYISASNLKPKNPAYLTQLAEAYYQIDEYEKAIENWKKVQNIDPGYEINYINKAIAEWIKDDADYEQAIIDCDIYISRNSKNEKSSVVYSLRGDCKYWLEQYDDAIEDFNKALELEGDNVTDLKNRAKTYYQMKEYEKALDDFNKVLEIDPEYEIDYFEKAYSEYKMKQHKEAIDDYTKYLSDYPESANAYNNRGLCQYKLENYKDAIEDYNKAIELNPEETLFINNRAEAYYWNDEYEEALNDWDKVLEIDPEYEINYYYRAYTKKELELYKEAIDDYTKYLSYYPENAKAYNNRGSCQYKLENYKDAIEDFNKAIELDPEEISFINNRAEAYYWNDEYEEALNDWDKVLEIDPEYEINYYYRAYTEDELGLYEEALLSIDKRINEEPDDEEAHNLKNIINSHIMN